MHLKLRSNLQLHLLYRIVTIGSGLVHSNSVPIAYRADYVRQCL